jgi:hypothetical protein
MFMKRKEISRLIASALAGSVIMNASPNAVKSVYAVVQDASSESSSQDDSSNSTSDSSSVSDDSDGTSSTNASELSGVSVDQMQNDFESQANSYNETVTEDENIEENGINKSSIKARTTELATFSFDGENAGKIVITNSNILKTSKVQYSLDGGSNWTESSQSIIELSEAEINSITADNDILVSLVGADEEDYCRIDIQKAAAPTVDDLFKNDVENRFFGNLVNLQISLDNGKTWTDYDQRVPVDGYKVTKVRYKAHSQYLASDMSQFTFTADSTSATRTYISVLDISYFKACSEESISNRAANLVDGTETNWVSSAKTSDNNELYYTVGFDNIRYVNEVEYVPTSAEKGRLKSGEIYTSFDGKDWTLAKTFTNLDNNTSTKSITLDSPGFAKYVKIVATETYGSPSNTYFSGKRIQLYEDSTQKYTDSPMVIYSTTDDTYDSVTATLVLPEGFSATEYTHKFLENGSYVFKYNDASGAEHSITATVDNIKIDENLNSVYLSDLSYDTSLSSVSGSVMKDANPSSGAIGLIINGTGTTFKKGVGVNAPSEVVYNLEALSKVVTNFSAYVGIDKSKGANGSAKVTILASKDGQDWTVIDDTGVIYGNTSAEYVNVSFSGYKYLKLKSEALGTSGQNQVVFAEAKLVKDDYDVNNEVYYGFKSLSQYDASISSRTVEENFANHKKEILEREFVNRVGYENILYCSRYEVGVYDALKWLQTDSNALELFIEAGDFYSGTGYNALVALGKLYNECSADLSNLQYKKMIIATAVGYSKNIKTFLVNYGGNCVGAHPVESYKNFKEIYDNGGFVRQSEFESYPMELVRAVMDARINYDEMLWLRDYIEKKYPSSTQLNNWRRYNGYGYASYVNTAYNKPEFYSEENKDKWNEKYGFLDYGVSYGESSLYRIWMFMESGAICWGLSGLGMVLNELQGIPAIGTFQPGHEAYLLYSQDSSGNGKWSISDDISGWGKSYTRWGTTTQTEHRMLLGWGQKEYNTVNNQNIPNTSYILLAQDALNHYDDYLNSMYYQLIANSYDVDSSEYKTALDKSLECYDKNLDSIYNLYKYYLANPSTTNEDWYNLAKMISEKYTYFPLPMYELTNLIKAQVDDELTNISIEMMQNNALISSSVATSAESLQPDAAKQVANQLLGNINSSLATFSFSGDNANKIIINEKYANSTIQVRVSLDGGSTWEKFEDGSEFTLNHVIELTPEQVEKINATDDILVGLMGTTENYAIDIKEGKSLGSDIYKNDLENSLFGAIDNLQYSLDEGVTWSDYVGGLNPNVRFDGAIRVYFRYKPYDCYTYGPSGYYTFSDDNVDETSKYVQLKNVSIYDFSSEQTNTDKAANNMLDGNANTRWHTTWDWSDTNKYISVEFDKVRYINKIGYMPYTDDSGEMKSGNVYVSMDGENWTKVYEYKDLPNVANNTWKYITLDKTYEAKYIRIDSTESYYKTIEQKDLYFAGSQLSFYEDTTMTYNPEEDVTIKYSNEEATNQNVTATIELPEGCKIVEGESTTHEFTENGDFTFNYLDANGNQHSATATVNNIDKTAPSMNYEFDETNPTNKDVTLTITGFSEPDVKVIGIDELDENGQVVKSEDFTSTEDPSKNDVDSAFSIYPNSYTFTDNKTVVFRIMDKAGNVSTTQVKVNWIDKKAPIATITYDVNDPTNKDVTATITFDEEDVTITNNGGKNTYTFNGNDEFTFEFVDKAGNTGTAKAEVKWIDKELSKATVEYSETELTNNNVLATITGLAEDEEVISEGGNTHLFEDNGTFDFVVRDSVGNITTITAKVDNIDKVVPTVDISYDVKDWTNGSVKATLTNASEHITILNPSDGSDYHVFDDNGEFTFRFVDDAGNIGTATAKVDWIDKDAPIANVNYSTKSPTKDPVTVTLTDFSEEGVTIENNNNSPSYTFNENGKFEFILVDRAGNKTTIPVEVNWIDNEAPDVKVEYSVTKWTNENVVAKVTGLKDGEYVVGESSYEFTSNGTYEFLVRDEAGNETKLVANVDWIDKEAPKVTVSYNITDPTNKDVVATVEGLKDGESVVSEGGTTHVFHENGSFEFVIRDLAGNETRVTATVNNIDKVAPIARVEFEYVGDKVIARLTDASENITITNPTDGKDYYEFTQNGSFTFKFVDAVGNEGQVEAVVDWIDFDDLSNLISFQNLAINDESGLADATKADYVVATFSVGNEIEILNNDGSNEVVFDKNGTFKFRARMRTTGYEFDMVVTVDWLSENATGDEEAVISKDELPDNVVVVNPSGDESTGDNDQLVPPVNGDDSNNNSSDENGSSNGDSSSTGDDSVAPPINGDDSADQKPSDDETVVPPVDEDKPVIDDSTVDKDEVVGDTNGDTTVDKDDTTDGATGNENTGNVDAESSSDSEDVTVPPVDNSTNDSANGSEDNSNDVDNNTSNDDSSTPVVPPVDEDKPVIDDSTVDKDDTTDGVTGNENTGNVDTEGSSDSEDVTVPPVDNSTNDSANGLVGGSEDNVINGSEDNSNDVDNNTSNDNSSTPVVPPVTIPDNSNNSTNVNNNSNSSNTGNSSGSGNGGNSGGSGSGGNGNSGDGNKPSNSEVNIAEIINDLTSAGLDVSFTDKVESNTVTSSSSSTNPSTENYNTEDYSKENSNTEASVSNSSADDNSSEESSHKGLLATVASAISMTLGAIFAWIRKLLGFIK